MSPRRFTPPYPYAHPITGEVFSIRERFPVHEVTKTRPAPDVTSAFGRPIEDLARMLGGEVTGGQILCPAPGHSRRDRGLSVKLDPSAQDGFMVNVFNACDDDDWRHARDHVKRAWGLPVRHNGQSYRAPAAQDFAAQDRQPTDTQNRHPSEKD